MNKKIISVLLQLPLVLIVIASLFGAIYAVIAKIGEVSLAVPILIFVVIFLYFYGRHLENKSRRDVFC